MQTLVGEDLNIHQNLSKKMLLVNGAKRHLEWGHAKHVIETIQNHPVQVTARHKPYMRISFQN